MVKLQATQTIRSRCRNGHRMVEGNIYTRKDGRKACRECMLLADKRYKARRKAAEI